MAAKKNAVVTSESGATLRDSFDKELFKRSVLYNIKTLYRKTLEEASPQQIFQAVSYAIKDQVVDMWLETQKQYEKKDPKTVYYLSMEFLMGRAMGNMMINMKAYKDVKAALEELGLDRYEECDGRNHTLLSETEASFIGGLGGRKVAIS